jgi:Flp pilus assembly pilin Flp
MLPPWIASYRTALETMLGDDSGQALVEYCIIMATLTILMMVAYRSIGSVANVKANNNVTNMTHSSVVVP